MSYINPIYQLNKRITTRTLLEQCDFRRFDGEIVYRFPVYKYNNRPLIYGEFVYNEKENQLHVRAVDNNWNACSYNREYYGASDVVENTNKKIQDKINDFIERGLIEC